MRILFVLYHGMDCNSAHHIAGLAGELVAYGDECIVAVPDGSCAESPLTVVSHADARRGAFGAAGDWRPDVVVAWTPRENVRRVALSVVNRWKCALVVHLEDNEDSITARYLGMSMRTLGWRSRFPIRALRGLALSHPIRMRRLIARADGVTMLMERLEEFCPSGKPREVFWPGYDGAIFDVDANLASTRKTKDKRDARAAVRAAGVPDNAAALVYTGNIHRGNVADMESLYSAVALLNKRGSAVHLVRTGETHAALDAGIMNVAAEFVHDIGFVPREELPLLLAGADALVQPGAPGVFNDYRFPSKLPEFLVSGHPVIMAATNLGLVLKDGEQALIAGMGSVEEIATAVERLLLDKHLAQRVGSGGQQFARQYLRWELAAQKFRALCHLACVTR